MTNQIKRAIKPIKAIKKTLPAGNHKVKIQDVSDVYEFSTGTGKKLNAVDITFEGEYFGKPLVTTEKLIILSGLDTPLQKLIWITGLEENEEGYLDLNDLIGKKVNMTLTKVNGFTNVTDFDMELSQKEIMRKMFE